MTSTKNRPMPLTSSVVLKMMARFRNFYNVKKSQDLFKKAQCVSNRCKDLFKQTKYFGAMGTLTIIHRSQSTRAKSTIHWCGIYYKFTVVYCESVRMIVYITVFYLLIVNSYAPVHIARHAWTWCNIVKQFFSTRYLTFFFFLCNKTTVNLY